jgi:hypothetical protein
MSDNDPVFTEADLGGTIDCDLTGWLPIDLGTASATEQWCVTLIAGLRHDPATALWGVARWADLQRPVCCFTASMTSTATQLHAAATHAFTAPGQSTAGRGRARPSSRS